MKSWTTKKTSRCLPRSAACNHNLKSTQNNSQQWNQSMVELEGNKSENTNVSQNLWATLHQFQQKVKQRNPYELQPSNTFGWSKRGAHQLIPENEVGHSPTRVSTGSQLIENIKIRWNLDVRLRGVNIKLWTNARGTTLFTAARRTPARTIEPGHPLRKTRPDETVESQWDEEEDATKTKMTNVEMQCNTN